MFKTALHYQGSIKQVFKGWKKKYLRFFQNLPNSTFSHGSESFYDPFFQIIAYEVTFIGYGQWHSLIKLKGQNFVVLIENNKTTMLIANESKIKATSILRSLLFNLQWPVKPNQPNKSRSIHCQLVGLARRNSIIMLIFM